MEGPCISSFNDSYLYDGVNRLAAVYDNDVNNNPLWARIFGYDRYGNMWLSVNSGVPLYGTTPTSSTNFNTATNRLISGARFDAAGNQTEVGSYSVAYDAENRQSVVEDNVSEGQASYGYDGLGQRVTKSNNGVVSTLYVYDVFGNLAAEYNSFGAQQSPCSTCYLSYDHLGSVRMVTDNTNSANIIARHDYLPFGEEIPANTVGRRAEWGPFSDKVDQKFTGQERDDETGFDFFHARYFYGAQGRFNSPDTPFADQNTEDPQSWNLYSYVRNNPLNRTDPNGRLTVIIPGTFWSSSNWNDNMKLFNEAREKFHDPDVRILNWSGSLTYSGRAEGVQMLDQMVAEHTFAPGEQLNIVAFSRGGDIAIDASNNISHKIDNLITLDSPGDYLSNANMANVNMWLNVSVDQDWVISLFSDDASKARNEPGANNLHLSAPQYGHIAAHTAVWQDDQLRDLWWRYWQDHAACYEWWDDKTNTLHGCP